MKWDRVVNIWNDALDEVFDLSHIGFVHFVNDNRTVSLFGNVNGKIVEGHCFKSVNLVYK